MKTNRREGEDGLRRDREPLEGADLRLDQELRKLFGSIHSEVNRQAPSAEDFSRRLSTAIAKSKIAGQTSGNVVSFRRGFFWQLFTEQRRGVVAAAVLLIALFGAILYIPYATRSSEDLSRVESQPIEQEGDSSVGGGEPSAAEVAMLEPPQLRERVVDEPRQPARRSEEKQEAEVSLSFRDEGYTGLPATPEQGLRFAESAPESGEQLARSSESASLGAALQSDGRDLTLLALRNAVEEAPTDREKLRLLERLRDYQSRIGDREAVERSEKAIGVLKERLALEKE